MTANDLSLIHDVWLFDISEQSLNIINAMQNKTNMSLTNQQDMITFIETIGAVPELMEDDRFYERKDRFSHLAMVTQIKNSVPFIKRINVNFTDTNHMNLQIHYYHKQKDGYNTTKLFDTNYAFMDVLKHYNSGDLEVEYHDDNYLFALQINENKLVCNPIGLE